MEESFAVAGGGKGHTPDRCLGSLGSSENPNRSWQEPSSSKNMGKEPGQDAPISVYCPGSEWMVSYWAFSLHLGALLWVFH